jgi:hypothetical protein
MQVSHQRICRKPTMVIADDAEVVRLAASWDPDIPEPNKGVIGSDGVARQPCFGRIGPKLTSNKTLGLAA